MANNVKVSIIIPVYNVEKYLRECLDSALNQSLKEIEIICVNDGSTDSSVDILKEYSLKDSRVKIISKKNSGYGNTMNVGIKAARGEYINFLESDDLIEADMLETLYNIAQKAEEIDIIKGDYYEYFGEQGQLKPIELLKNKEYYNKCLEPSGNLWLFYVPMMNCLGLFKREFIVKNGILHNETPGASHQDMGFWFQTFCLARKVYFVNKPFYKYRQDNMSSSMNTLSSENKIYCVHDEYLYIFEFLKRNEKIRKWVAPVFYHRFFGSSYFRYNNFVNYLKPLFLHVFGEDLKFYSQEKDFTLDRFSLNERKIVHELIEDSQAFFLKETTNNNEIFILKSKIKELERYRNSSNNNLIRKFELNSKNIHKVSVIIPVYNVEKYLRDCLDSIINQTLGDIEIICINDGSTDNSLSILEEYQRKDSRIQVYSQPNLGQSAARNSGLEKATGECIYFMDSDDKLDTTALEYCYNELLKNKLDILYFDAEVFFDNLSVKEMHRIPEDTYKREKSYDSIYTGLELFRIFKLQNKYRVSPCLQFFKRDFLVEYGINFVDGIIYEDNIFALKVLLNAQRVSHRNIPLFKRRIREYSTTTKPLTWKNFYGYFICFIEMSYLVIKYPISKEIEISIVDELLQIKRRSKNILNTLSEAELKNYEILNEVEKMYFNLLFRDNKTLIEKNYSNKIIQKIDGCIKCYQEHGLKYTLKRIYLHLIGKAR